MKFTLALASILLAGLINPTFANDACMQGSGKDPLVGVWYGSFTSDPGTDHEYLGYGTVTIHADGTAVAGDTTNTGGLGNLATAPTGVWKKIKPNHYKITAITIYSSTATLPGKTKPVYTFVEHANIQLSEDCMTISSYDDTYGIYSPSDFSFEKPLALGTLQQTYQRMMN